MDSYNLKKCLWIKNLRTALWVALVQGLSRCCSLWATTADIWRHNYCWLLRMGLPIPGHMDLSTALLECLHGIWFHQEQLFQEQGRSHTIIYDLALGVTCILSATSEWATEVNSIWHGGDYIKLWTQEDNWGHSGVWDHHSIQEESSINGECYPHASEPYTVPFLFLREHPDSDVCVFGSLTTHYVHPVSLKSFSLKNAKDKAGSRVLGTYCPSLCPWTIHSANDVRTLFTVTGLCPPAQRCPAVSPEIKNGTCPRLK